MGINIDEMFNGFLDNDPLHYKAAICIGILFNALILLDIQYIIISTATFSLGWH